MKNSRSELRLLAGAQPQATIYPEIMLERQQLGCGFATMSSMCAEQEPVSRGLILDLNEIQFELSVAHLT